jgi:hypothetical protein
VIRSSLKDIKKAIKNLYKSPFKVSSYNEELEGEMANFVVIEDINNRTLARFQYLKEDGAIISGYNDSPLYKKEREQHFPEYYDAQYLTTYQKVFDLFYNNAVVKEYVQNHSLGVVNKNMFDISDDHRRGVPLIKPFSFLGNSSRSDTAIGLQYYLNEKSQLTPRMKIQFSFSSCGNLIIYYDYSSNCFRFCDVQLIAGYKASSLDEDMLAELLHLEPDESLDTDNKLDTLFTNWMLLMGSHLNKQAFVHYNLDELIDASNKDKTLEHLNLIKMAFI